MLINKRAYKGDIGPAVYLFPTEGETPLRRDNVWHRDMRPELEPVGLEWATFQVPKRTNASLSRRQRSTTR